MNDTQISDNKDSNQRLLQLGWSPYFQAQLDSSPSADGTPARVVGVGKNLFRVRDGQKERLASLAGRLRYASGGSYPVTGDWVLLTDSVICRVLERKNSLSRGASGAHQKAEALPQKEQLLAANLDNVFIVSGLDRDFNLRRIERYLTLVYNCGLRPVIILTKADLHQEPEFCANEVENIACGVPIHLVSAADDEGLTGLGQYLGCGQTTTLIGSSGAGKSTLVNRLCGEPVQLTAAVSEQVGKGRHTTTSRDLFMVPQGGMIIDNPGIREIAFWDGESGLSAAFPDIERLAVHCRFRDCSHLHEPGCHVREAVARGELAAERLANYEKMKREQDYLAQRQNKSADRVEKERWKDVAQKIKAIKKSWK
ncbi:ribosome small subunit-dependent GTPase A [Pelobacter seleniigenes]|uniref:ribosome small subunit-dependent GTPase A n=1 Tax=Pelobacter seleniigenes TaxID=407188 RepID=UPI000564D7CC|nr:ribosome small subunit-dependent GTPase A [Pelobacter seleniigenes]